VGDSYENKNIEFQFCMDGWMAPLIFHLGAQSLQNHNFILAREQPDRVEEPI
jgi:hypothetical protein